MRSFRSMLLATAMLPLFGHFSYAVPLIPFDAPESKQMLFDATERPEIWTSVADVLRVYTAQSSQAFCGVATLTIALNSLGIPGHVSVDDWFPYLFMNQHTALSMDVSSVKGKNKINMEGITLAQLGEMANTNKYVRATVYHATPELGLEGFRKILIEAMADPNSRVTVNYLREGLNQKTGGHHSPLAAYDPKSGRVLLADTATYKSGPQYDKTTKAPKVDAAGNLVEGLGDGSGQPVWVTIEDLWAAINTVDNDAKAYRGIVVITKKPLSEIRAAENKDAENVLRKNGIWAFFASFWPFGK